MDVPLPIITVSEAGDHFELNESNLQIVLDAVEKINPNRVVILSVVGAFRTGKSLLLDFFLRYLRHSAEEDSEGVIVDSDAFGTDPISLPAWMTAGTNFLKSSRGDVDGQPGGIPKSESKTVEAAPAAVAPTGPVSRKKKKKQQETAVNAASAEDDSGVKNTSESESSTATLPSTETPALTTSSVSTGSGFIWRPGKERTTTGIWMYGKPFARELPGSKEKVAVVLMDTQGMFDFNTTKELTAAIFGLSTLISSYEIYNVTKQIQEDYLQQLHYFTEFSRVALKEFEQAQKRADKKDQKDNKIGDLAKAGPFSPKNIPGKKTPKAMKSPSAGGNNTPSSSAQASPLLSPRTEAKTPSMHPFQTLQFLVRDWANFSDDEDLETCLQEMPRVLDTAMNATVEDGGTRNQLRAAFENIACYLLPHPGIPMTKPKYDGDITAIERPFLRLLDNFIHQVFERGLVTKKIQGREVSPSALFKYIKAYAGIFKDGRLPQTMTLVQAISVTTNLCAKDDALIVYKKEMDKVLGGDKYVSTEVLEETHQAAFEGATEKFDSLAIFGEETHIEDTRTKLNETIENEKVNYFKTNDLKMQSGLQRFILPIIIAFTAFLLDRITDYTCDAWSENCRSLSLLFFYVYFLVFVMLCYQFYLIYKQQGSAAVGMSAMALGHATFQKVKSFQDLLANEKNSDKTKKDA